MIERNEIPQLMVDEVRPKPYVLGEQVTRDTFMDYYIMSHAGSRGTRAGQVIFLEWGAVNFGSDDLSLVREIKEQGGWDSLPTTEKQMFVNAFNRIADHGNKRDSKSLNNGGFFDANLFLLTSAESIKHREELRPQVEGLTYAEMRKMQDDAYKVYLDYRAWRDDFLD